MILFVGAMNVGLARNAGDPLKPGFNLYSKQQDIELGKQSASRIQQQYQQVQSRDLQAYVKKIGERLTKTPSASSSGFPFSFTLLNYKEVNAFALPGGPAFIFTGLIKASDSEAELAGVLAHEISHVVLRHGTHQATKANIIEHPARIIRAVNSLTLFGRLINVGLGLELNGIFLKYSRTDESEADALGAHIMSEAGYDPAELARFFEKLDAQGGPGVPEFLSDHPSPGNRVEAVEAEARTLPPRLYLSDKGEFERVKVAIAKLPPPPDLRPKNIRVGISNVSPYLRDFRVGQVLRPKLPLARAVAASSAFPPILSPCEIDVSQYGMKFEPRGEGEDLNRQPFTTKLVLSDGGVYDNLGLETAWKRYETILLFGLLSTGSATGEAQRATAQFAGRRTPASRRHG